MVATFNIALLVVSFCVAVANIAVCVLVVTRKTLRTYTNGLVISLAISDMLTGGVWMPTNVLNPMYLANGFIAMLVISSSTCNLSALAYERYIAVFKPFQYKAKIEKVFFRLVCAVWGVSVAMTLLPLLWSADTSLLVHKVYLSCAVAMLLVLPTIFIVLVYSLIFVRLRRHGKLMLNANTFRTQLDEARRSLKESKTAKIFFTAVIIFIISWAPVIFMTFADVSDRYNLVPIYLGIVSNFTIVLSSLVNPFLYTFMKRDFQQQLRMLFHCQRAELGRGRTTHLTHVSSACVNAKAI